MIPLAQWLTDRQGSPPAAEPSAEEAAEQAPTLESMTISQMTVTLEEQQSHAAKLAASLAAAEERAAELADTLVRREQELRALLGEELGRRLEEGVSQGFATMQAVLEEALHDVLTPFLADAARRRVITELKNLLDKQLREADAPVMEIRVPPELHEALEAFCQQLAPAATLTAGDTIEVVFTGHRQRFEELSARWRAVIEGAEP